MEIFPRVKEYQILTANVPVMIHTMGGWNASKMLLQQRHRDEIARL